ncbi:hypothetical protein J5N97_021406 [Dioscorea zingiberensis]|uniref:Uncharacterized protein n=1 Tax=Dioscorea zingiberensis TaxID=325984 RepID=A0A9D5CHL8_9LILI|nr:hypothetical protein J5N97_021406 [Dioscorea zingiberensis]
MRNFASCLSEHAVRVSDTSCSGGGGGAISSSSSNISLTLSDRSMKNSVTCFYKTRLSTCKELFFNLTWSKTNTGPSLSIAIDDNIQVLRKKEGNKSYKHQDSLISLYWDFSSARYTCGCLEPAENFYLVIMADAEFALLLGDLSRDFVRMSENSCVPIADFSLVSREEQAFTNGVYRTKAWFLDSGKVHEITIKCMKESGLWVWVDKKKVVQEQRLDWNFRGNQIVFIDGLSVDFLWDVFDLQFGGPSGCGVFAFRTRSSLESRLWLEEEVVQQKEHNFSGFSLLIQAFKSL